MTITETANIEYTEEKAQVIAAEGEGVRVEGNAV